MNKRRVRRFLSTIPAGLEHLYDRILGIVEDATIDDLIIRQEILSTMVMASQPLRVHEIQSLINAVGVEYEDFDCIEEVRACGSFFTIRDDVVYFVHQSAKDYFVDGPGSKIFSSSYAVTHKALAQRCVRQMTKSLKKNICRLQHPGVIVPEVPKDIIEDNVGRVQYYCQYWLRHLQMNRNFQENSIDFDSNSYIHLFLRESLLYWLEALSLIGKLSTGVQDIIKVLGMLAVGYNLVLLSGLKKTDNPRNNNIQNYT